LEPLVIEIHICYSITKERITECNKENIIYAFLCIRMQCKIKEVKMKYYQKRLLLKPKEAAEVIQVCRSKMYLMLAEGLLPSIRIGKSIRIPLKALEGWVEECQSNTKTVYTPLEKGYPKPYESQRNGDNI